MNEKNSALFKICSYCGETKPLTAFLQFSEDKGTHYGSVCSSCRKAAIAAKGKKREGEEATTSTSGLKIDSKSKVQSEVDKRKLRKEQTEEDEKNKEKKDEVHTEVQNKKQNVSLNEKKHRKGYLEKRPFEANRTASTHDETLIVGGETQKEKEGKVDLAHEFRDTQIAGKLKTQSSIFKTFETWLGDTPLTRAARKATTNNQNKPDQKPDPVAEFVKKHGSKK